MAKQLTNRIKLGEKVAQIRADATKLAKQMSSCPDAVTPAIPKIYKYSLEIVDIQNILMPIGSNIIAVGHQQGQLVLWAEVYDMQEDTERVFCIYGTGSQIDPFDKYVGTVNMGVFVWHIYEFDAIAILTKINGL